LLNWYCLDQGPLHNPPHASKLPLQNCFFFLPSIISFSCFQVNRADGLIHQYSWNSL
jgi:hypothetical protein